MDLSFNGELASQYHSASQKARVLTESWVEHNLFCPRCGNEHISHFSNNRPVADFFCQNCGCQYELKSKRGGLGSKIADGAYKTMIERISCNENPDFLFMSYLPNEMRVTDLILIPKFFFTPEIIEKRVPLSQGARRAGWIGCNILIDQIPQQGRICIINGGREEKKEDILERVRISQGLKTESLHARGWIMDILNCVNLISTDRFTLDDMYRYENLLSVKHPENNNIRPKIRQQLQVLRDKGFIEFLGSGNYRKKK